MKIKESIAKGFKVSKNSMNVVLVLFVFGAIWNVINVALTPQLATAQNAPAPVASAGVIGAGLVFMLLSVFIQGGSLGFIRDLVKTGKAEFSSFTASGGKYYLKLFLLGLLVAAIVGVLILLAAVAVAVLAKAANVVGIILALLLASLGIYFALLILLAPYAIVVDGSGVMASVKHSIKLVKQNILTVLAIVGLLILIGFGIGIVMGALFALIRLGIPGTASDYVFGILGSFVNAYLGVVVTGSFMNLYLSVSNNNTSGA